STIGGIGGFGIYNMPSSGGGSGGGSKGKVICGELIMLGNKVNSLNKNQSTKTQSKVTTEPGPCPQGEILLPVNKTPYKINNNLTNPCANNIFTELETEMLKKDLLQKIMHPTQNVNLNFSESILKLFNDSSLFNYSITNGDLKDSNGSTNGISTTISNFYLKNATQLSIARTIIHEMVHAYLNVKYKNAMSFDNGLDFKL